MADWNTISPLDESVGSSTAGDAAGDAAGGAGVACKVAGTAGVVELVGKDMSS